MYSLANQIGNAIIDTNMIFVTLDQFIDHGQIKEVVELLASEGNLTIRASVCQGLVTFFNESSWNHY